MSMQLPENRFKSALSQKKRQIGLWCSLSSPLASEAVSLSGFDWLVIDMEHAPSDLPQVLAQLHAVSRGTASAVVRPPWNDFVVIKRLLDAGVTSLVIPYVQNREEAERAVAAIRYPPHGIRGVAAGARSSAFGRVRNYLKDAHTQLCLILQVETAEALAQLEEIAGVDGVDGVFIGPADLSASLGHMGNPGAEPVQEAIREAAARLKKIGKAAGILATVEADARRYISWGYDFVAVGTDAGLLVRTADALAANFREG
jgi:4-hydroxy-2-oxoheptanedioate aldolase